MRLIAVLCLSAVLLGLSVYLARGTNRDVPYSNLKPDETVVFFRGTAWLDVESQEWNVPIHGWVYEPEDSRSRMAIFETVLSDSYELAPNKDTEANFERRINLIIADNERGKQLVVSVAGRDYALPPSETNGHFEMTLSIPVADVEKFAEGDFLEYSAVLREQETRTFAGEVKLVAPSGLSIISDIDDTVKISNVTDRTSLLEHTFLLDFKAVPGMAQLYSKWSEQGASFHFVSSSPWQLYAPLSEFLDERAFPWASFGLKAVRFRDETLFDLFKKGTETKPATIEKILATYPNRRFMLIGDSGEQDPEVYAALLRKFPNQIVKAYIRNVTAETPDNARFEGVFSGIDPDCWLLFEDPGSIVVADVSH